jgi:hypothetical protein
MWEAGLGVVFGLNGVGGRSSEGMPEKPPATRRVRQRGIIRVTAKEMTAAAAIRSTSRGSEKGLGQVNLDKAPAGAKSAGRAMGDKEQPTTERDR